GHGDGIGTCHNGRPSASACASSSSTRTACMATRCTDSLIVVRSAPSSTSGMRRSTCTSHALSFPLDQETRHFVIWLSGYLVIWLFGYLVIWLCGWHGSCDILRVMSIESEQLKERTMRFGLDVLCLIDTFPRTIAGDLVSRQIAKSATS